MVSYCRHCAIYLHAWYHGTYSLLVLWNEIKCLTHWKQKGKTVLFNRWKLRFSILVAPSSIMHGICSRSGRSTLISRVLLQWLNHKVTAPSFLSVTVTICSLWCKEPPVVCLSFTELFLEEMFFFLFFSPLSEDCVKNRMSLLKDVIFFHESVKVPGLLLTFNFSR